MLSMISHRLHVQKAEGGPKGLDTTWVSPRLLLLTSSLLVMMVARDDPGSHAPRLAAFLVAALLTGVALLHPRVVGDTLREQRAAGALVVILSAAGVLMTAWMLLPTFSGLAPPWGFAAIAVYAIAGLTAARSLAQAWPNSRWALFFFLVAHTAITVGLLRTTPAQIDVEVYLREGVIALFDGRNPYSSTIPNIFTPHGTELFYGPGVVVDGRVTSGFPYMPLALLAAIPGQIFGDVRYSQLIAMVATAVVMCSLASDRIGRATAVLGVASLSAIPMLTGAWTEPTIVAVLAGLVFALQRGRLALVAVLLGLFLVSKQYVVVALPIIWLIRKSLTRRTILLGLGVATAVTLPFLLVNPADSWNALVHFQLVQPFRPDSVSLLVSSVNTFGWPPPWTYGVLPLVGGGLTAVALALRAPRTPAAFAASVGLALLVTILFSKQAFLNYYFLVNGALLIAAVSWPTTDGAASGHGRDAVESRVETSSERN